MTKQDKAHQPFMHGYNANDMKNWSPETDKYAKYFRSRVPLAERIPPFSATQANPNLNAGPQVMNLSADYDKKDTVFKYNDTFCCNLLKFWQYTDLYGSWHGLPLEGSRTDEPIYGVINLPNPAYTDAAHRNGVLSLGCWFWPREEETFADLLVQKLDGSFPVADKMIEMALYFGFDGYFINQEATISAEDSQKLLEMMKYFSKKAPAYFHLQWYDTLILNGELRYQNQFNDKNAPWLIDDNKEPIIDSMFINYAFNEDRMVHSHQFAKEIGLDPYKSLFPGTENDKYGYNPPYDTRLIFPENKSPRAGWGLFGTDFVWNRYENKFDPDDQEEVYKRERRYWSGPIEDPTDRVGRTLYKPYKDPFHEVDRENYKKWDGVAHYIPERSVIGSYPFVTRFNTGHGKAFFLNGEMVSNKEWNNASIQDILPSWQWWTQRFDAMNNPVSETKSVSERPLKPSYDYSTAYDGGSSLKVSGKLEPAVKTELRLFKTKLPITNDVRLSLTYKIAYANAPNNMELGLIFEDAPDQFVWLDMENSVDNNWNTQTFALEAYANRTIATIGLRFSSATESEYEVYIGELALTNELEKIPPVPTGFTIDKEYFESDTAELFLSWDFNKDDVWYYDMYQIKSNREKEMLGRIYDEVYYIKSLHRLNNETTSTLELVAVGFDGATSTPTKTNLTWPI
ncbi:endo-beta-N-acetylglucosaminidase [Bacillus sp. FSL K6-3431]|uniref:endo-beta-N-acetylglucosaminidase n=1 Tax=Bacillus sp. FSL K6-3431 TaxID=2921500 RepID=UPI0030FC4C40